MLIVFLAGCAAADLPPVHSLDITNCDPRERADCWSVTESAIKNMMDAYEEGQKAKAALSFCKEGI